MEQYIKQLIEQNGVLESTALRILMQEFFNIFKAKQFIELHFDYSDQVVEGELITYCPICYNEVTA